MEAVVAIVFAALFRGASSLCLVPWCLVQVPGFAVKVKHLDYLPAKGLETLIRLCCDGGSARQTDLADLNQLFASIYFGAPWWAWLWCAPCSWPGHARRQIWTGMERGHCFRFGQLHDLWPSTGMVPCHNYLSCPDAFGSWLPQSLSSCFG